jgi:RNA polymerase sigma-70 factor, ECF subfamily
MSAKVNIFRLCLRGRPFKTDFTGMKAIDGLKGSEHELIKRIISGEPDLFSALVEKHRNMVFRTCMGYFHDSDEAEDLTQEIFIQAFLSLSSYRGDSSFSTWLYRISINACLNLIRREKNSPFAGRLVNMFSGEGQKDVYPVVDLPDIDDPESIIIRNEHLKWLQGMLDSLPDSQRTAIILSKYDDLSQREIAEIMQISEGAVEALLQRAKKNLRERMQNSRKKYHNDRRKK